MNIDKRVAVTGILLLLLGGIATYASLDFGLGSARRMGAGYFTLIIGVALILLGIILVLSAPGKPTTVYPIAWRASGAVVGGMVLFALLFPRFGLVPAVAAVISVSALGDKDLKFKSIFILTLGTAAVTWFLFIVLLRLPVAAFRWNL